MQETVVAWALLVVAALLESGGDAGVRLGLRGRAWGFVIGPLALVAYGFVVDGPRWEFSRLMGVYIAVYFVVSQLLALFGFRERLPLPVLAGGTLIVAGGLLMTFWHLPTR